MSNGWKSYCRMHGTDMQNYLASHPHMTKDRQELLAHIIHLLMPQYLDDWPNAPAEMIHTPVDPVQEVGAEEAASE